MYAKNRKTIFIIGTCLFLVLTLVLLFTSVTYAGKTSPFIGQWFAVDVDDSEIRLTIAGPPSGPFQITWTESYISFCGGETGIIRGQGVLVESNMMTASLTIVCFTTGESTDFEFTWVYDQGTDTLNGDFITWHRANSKPCISPPAGLSGWWPGDGNASDLIFGRDGTFQGDATTDSGLVGFAFKLDGDGDFIEVADDQGLNFGPGDFTIDLWVNFEDTTGEQVLVEKFIQSDNGWTFTKLSDNVLRLAFDNGSGEEFDLDTDPLKIHSRTWYHFAATRQGSLVKIYMNGENVASNPEVGPMNLNSPASLKIGCRGDIRGFFLNGRVDEVEIFNGTALSGEQIMAIYHAGNGGKCKENLITPPYFGLRVNYRHDWVESFYKAGHSVKIMVTTGDGETVKATATLVTEPKDFWNGESGFQSSPEDWIPGLLDIQPFDWVFGWVDNGASAQVQIGEINGVIDLDDDTITGTVYAPWFLPEPDVEIDCHSWGAPFPDEIIKSDSVSPNGEDTYTCSWADEWDIDYYQLVGVGYSGPDGNWVANAFVVVNPHFTIFPEWEWFDGIDWPDGEVAITVAEKSICDTHAESNGGFFNGGFPEECDVVVGDTVRMTDGFTTREHVVQNLAVTGWDVDLDTLTGIADEGTQVVVWPHEHDYAMQTPVADVEDSWTADFSSVPFDLDYYQGGRALIYDDMGNATAVDWYIRNPHFTIFPEWDWYDAMDWPDGATVIITVDGKEGYCHAEHTSWGNFFNGGFPEECDVVIGDTVRMTDGFTTREHVVQNLAVIGWDVFADTVRGTADEGAELVVWVHEHDESMVYPVAGGNGTWTADFASVPFDLDYLMGGRAMIYDEMGNATAVDWGIPEPPHMWIWIEWNAVDGHGWGLNEDITLTINYGEHVLIQNTGYGTSLSFDVGAVGHDIVPGDVIAMSNGVVTKMMEVPPLVITGYDLDANTVQGTGDSRLFLFSYVNGQPALAVTWTGDTWVALFDELFEEQWGDAVQVDGDNDAAAATIHTVGL